MTAIRYRVDWDDQGGHHTYWDLTWVEACAAYHRLDLIPGCRGVRISSQAGVT